MYLWLHYLVSVWDKPGDIDLQALHEWEQELT